MGARGDLGDDAAEACVLLDRGGDRVGEQRVAAYDADPGLVAGRLDAQHERFGGGHRAIVHRRLGARVGRMDLLDDARGMKDDLVRLRTELHQDPEVGLDLPRTQEQVLRALDDLGLEISTGQDTTSVTAVLRGGARDADDPRTVLLRADMDALPVSRRPGSRSRPPTARCTRAGTTSTPPA